MELSITSASAVSSEYPMSRMLSMSMAALGGAECVPGIGFRSSPSKAGSRAKFVELRQDLGVYARPPTKPAKAPLRCECGLGRRRGARSAVQRDGRPHRELPDRSLPRLRRSEEHTSELQSRQYL